MPDSRVITDPPGPGAAGSSAAPSLLDPSAFAAVFRQFYAPLFRYAQRFTSDPATASDVLQDVFLKLWQDRATLKVQVSLQALLYTMVRNRALNLKRRAAWAAPDVDPAAARDRLETAPPSEGALEAQDLRRHLARWIAALPPRRAEAFTLSRYHGLRHSEIAAIMGVSERTVDTHILLALRTLRARLDTFERPASDG